MRKKLKGLALCLAHDVAKGWMSNFQTFFFHNILYTVRFCKNKENPMVLFSLCEAHEKVTLRKDTVLEF